MKKRSLFIVSGVFGLLMISLMVGFVSAGVFFSGLDSKYNLGDMIDITINVDPIAEGDNRLLKVSLFCNDNKVIEFNNLPDEMGDVNVKLPLNFFTIDQANGPCYFLGEYSEDAVRSNVFEISKLLIIKLSKDAFFANPGEEIVVSGTVEKLNGNFVNGEIEISIPLLSLFQPEIVEEVVDEEVSESENDEVVDEDGEEVVEESDSDSSSEENTESEEVVEGEEAIEGVVEEVENFDAGKFYGKVVDGDFSVSIKLIKDVPAGDFRIDIIAYEGVSTQRTSEGITMANLKVFQILSNIDLALNNQNFDPGSLIEVKPSLLDQTGINIDDEVSIVIRGEDTTRYFEKIGRSLETIGYKLPTNLSSGYYDIEASSGEASDVKKFFVNEKAIVSFELVNDSLIVTNIGNIPYNKDIEVELNGKPFIKKVDLDLGESKKFKLTGPGDEYNIRVSDGESEIAQNGVMLTGNAVNVNAINEGGLSVGGPIGWIFVIIVLGIGLLFLFRNVFKKKSFAFHRNKKGVVELAGQQQVVQEKKEDGNEAVKGPEEKNLEKSPVVNNQADQVLVLKGHKSNAAVLVLKIKNKIGKAEKQSLEKAIEHVYDKKGAVYEQGDFIFIVFSPLMTRTNKNEVEAAKVAEKVVRVLKEHNKKFKDKIDFGIGINSGEIINKVENKKLKFTALGNFIVIAKRLAESSDKQVLVTKGSYEKGISEIKAEKRKLNEGEVYEIRGVIDTDKNKKFIRKFLDRQKKD